MTGHGGPGEYQAGLEVVPESDAPEVVTKSWDERTNSPWSSHTPGTQAGVYGGYSGTDYALAPGEYHHHPTQSESPQYWQGSQAMGGDPPPPEKPSETPTILGLNRRKFWLIFGPLIALAIIGIAVGLGVGLGTRKGGSTTTPSPSASAGLVCPSSNGTTYKTSSKQAFTILCALDYNRSGGTIDLTSKATKTIEDCIDLCASNGACMGAGWGDIDSTTTCWLKSSLGESQDAPRWFFAIKNGS